MLAFGRTLIYVVEIEIGCIYAILRCGLTTRNRAGTSMYSLTFCVRRYTVISTDCQYARRYVVIATQPVHWLQICPIVHKQRAPPTIPSYIRVRAVVWACVRGQTDRHRGTDTHRLAWPTVFPHPAKRLVCGTSPKWPILCRVGRKTTTQSTNPL